MKRKLQAIPSDTPVMTPTVVIKVFGGVVQGTVTNLPGLQVLVLDYDVDGVADEISSVFLEPDGKEERACPCWEPPLVDAGYVGSLVRTANRVDETPGAISA